MSVETERPEEIKTGDVRPKNGAGVTVGSDAPEAVKVKRGPSPRIRQIAILAGIVVAILIIIWGVRALAFAMTHETTDDAKVDADVVTITSKISERVAKIFVDTNQHVNKGQVLIQLDDRDERARYEQALAALQAQRATANAAQQNVALTRSTVQAQTQQGAGGVSSAASGIQNAQEQVSVAQQGVDQARAQLRAAQAGVPAAREALAKANIDFERTSTLVSSGDVARANLDTARATREAARSQYQQAIDNVAVAQAGVDAAIQRVAAAQAGVSGQQGQLVSAQGKLSESDSPFRVSAQQAQANAAEAQVGSLLAQLRIASEQLGYTKIFSPIDGYVGQKSVDIGQQVAPGTPLMTIVPLDKIYITANFKETQIGKMKSGQETEITVDAYKGVTFFGHVAAISPASQNTFSLVPAQNASGNFVKVTQRIPVRILIDRASRPLAEVPLRPGMSVVASVKVK